MRLLGGKNRLLIKRHKMARAHRHYLPGYIWHITQRCHKKEFLLRFKCYKKRWMYWLYIAKQKFHISIFNYMVTSNHIHLLALSDGKDNDIARTMHLVSGRTAWEFNHNRNRKGAFWEDRYKILFINDLLLGADKNYFYFYANGDPMFDEEADKSEIHVFSLKR